MTNVTAVTPPVKPASGKQAVTPSAPRSLADLERIIEGGIKTFVEVGHALQEIRDRRLYQPSYPTFEAYCRARWEPKLSRQHAHRLIQAAQVAEALSPIGDELVRKEGQARELVPLLEKPEAMQAVVKDVRQEVQKTGKPPTAATIRKAVQRIAPSVTVKASRPAASHGMTRRPPPVRWGTEPRPSKELEKELEELVTLAHNLAIAVGELPSTRAMRIPGHVVEQARKLLAFLKTKKLWTGAV